MENKFKKSFEDYQSGKPSCALVPRVVPGNVSTSVDPASIVITIYDESHVSLKLPAANCNGIFKFSTVLAAIQFLMDNYDLTQVNHV